MSSHLRAERRSRARDLDVLHLKYPQQLGLRARTGIGRRKYVSSGPFGVRLQNRALALLIEVLEQLMPVVGEVAQGYEQAGFLIVVVVAERPHHARKRWILSEPRARRLAGRKRPLQRLGRATVAERFVQPA